jgi:hypothetical protein
MLDQLIGITNSKEFIDRGDLNILEVNVQPQANNNLFLRLEILLEDEHTFESSSQVWEVKCLDILYGFSSSLYEYKRPYNQLNLYSEHPVLCNYEDDTSEVHISGDCKNIPELIGSLYLAHDQAYGQWVDFNNTFYRLAQELQSEKPAVLEFPSSIAKAYKPFFQARGLDYSIVRTNESSRDRDKIHALIFGNPLVCPDEYNLGQPYQIALGFEELRIS